MEGGKTMPKNDLTYQEIGRIPATESTSIVVSQVLDKAKEEVGFGIAKWIESEKFTGFASGAILVPGDMVLDFLAFFGKDCLSLALSQAEKE